MLKCHSLLGGRHGVVQEGGAAGGRVGVSLGAWPDSLPPWEAPSTLSSLQVIDPVIHSLSGCVLRASVCQAKSGLGMTG